MKVELKIDRLLSIKNTNKLDTKTGQLVTTLNCEVIVRNYPDFAKLAILQRRKPSDYAYLIVASEIAGIQSELDFNRMASGPIMQEFSVSPEPKEENNLPAGAIQSEMKVCTSCGAISTPEEIKNAVQSRCPHCGVPDDMFKNDTPTLACNTCKHEFPITEVAKFKNGKCPDCGLPFLPPPQPKEKSPRGRKRKGEDVVPGTAEQVLAMATPDSNGQAPEPIALAGIKCSCGKMFPGDKVEAAIKEATISDKYIALKCECGVLTRVEIKDVKIETPVAESGGISSATPVATPSAIFSVSPSSEQAGTAPVTTQPPKERKPRQPRKKKEEATQQEPAQTSPAPKQCQNCDYTPSTEEIEDIKADNKCPACQGDFEAKVPATV